MPRKQAERTFVAGDEVRIAKKSRVVDREREHEGLKDDERIPIDQDVTGTEGRVVGTPYASPTKDGETCIPIERNDGAVMSVPLRRLERVNRTPRVSGSSEDGGGFGSVSRETYEFWRKHFQKKGARQSRKKKRKRG